MTDRDRRCPGGRPAAAPAAVLAAAAAAVVLLCAACSSSGRGQAVGSSTAASGSASAAPPGGQAPGGLGQPPVAPGVGGAAPSAAPGGSLSPPPAGAVALAAHVVLAGAVRAEGDFSDVVGLTDIASCAAAAATGTVAGATETTRSFGMPSPEHDAAGKPVAVGGQLRAVDGAVDSYAGPRTYDGDAAGFTSVTTGSTGPEDGTQWGLGDGSTVSVVVRPDGGGQLRARHLLRQTQDNTAAPGPTLDVTLDWTCGPAKP